MIAITAIGMATEPQNFAIILGCVLGIGLGLIIITSIVVAGFVIKSKIKGIIAYYPCVVVMASSLFQVHLLYFTKEEYSMKGISKYMHVCNVYIYFDDMTMKKYTVRMLMLN